MLADKHQYNILQRNRYFIVLSNITLTLKAPITTAADDIHNFLSLFFRENKT